MNHLDFDKRTTLDGLRKVFPAKDHGINWREYVAYDELAANLKDLYYEKQLTATKAIKVQNFLGKTTFTSTRTN